MTPDPVRGACTHGAHRARTDRPHRRRHRRQRRPRDGGGARGTRRGRGRGARPGTRAHGLSAGGPARQGPLHRGCPRRARPGRGPLPRRDRARRLRGPRRTAGSYNAAAICRDGDRGGGLPEAPAPELRRLRRGALLRAGRASGPLRRGRRCRAALTICEDVWVPEPAAETGVARRRPRPQHLGVARSTSARDASARTCSATRARENGAWVAYCNLVGGQDELVFDGRIVVVAPDGAVIARAQRLRRGPARGRRARRRARRPRRGAAARRPTRRSTGR